VRAYGLWEPITVDVQAWRPELRQRVLIGLEAELRIN